MSEQQNLKSILCLPGSSISCNAITTALQFALAFKCDLILANILESEIGEKNQFSNQGLEFLARPPHIQHLETQQKSQEQKPQQRRDGHYRNRSMSLDTYLGMKGNLRSIDSGTRQSVQLSNQPITVPLNPKNSLIPIFKQVKKILKEIQKKQILQNALSIRILEKRGDFLEQIQSMVRGCEMVIMPKDEGDASTMKLVSNMDGAHKLIIVPSGENLLSLFQNTTNDNDSILEDKLSSFHNFSKIVFSDEFKDGKVQSTIIRDLISNFVEPINYFRRQLDQEKHNNRSSNSPRSKPIFISFIHLTMEYDSLNKIKTSFINEIKNAVGTYRHYDIQVFHAPDDSDNFAKNFIKIVKEFSPDFLVVIRKFRGTTDKFYWELRTSVTESILHQNFAQDQYESSVFIYRTQN